MQLSAINSINFRASSPTDYEKILRERDQKLEALKNLNMSQYVDSDDIKSPQETMAAITVAGARTFMGGAATAAAADKIVNHQASKAFGAAATRTSDAMKNASTRLAQSSGKKTGAILKKAGVILGKTRDVLKSAYTKIATDKGGNLSPSKAFIITVGVISMIIGLKHLLSKDSNNDGVKDIAQKSQDVYKDQATKQAGALDGLAKIAATAQQVLS